jgi:hypothetical protein
MIETLSHPAQSADFLSRLHDGELETAESAAFEAHRRECPECEASVADFERALAAYRSAPVPPHATDLSARILRKIRAASPSRRPFGVMFGIDVRWAGALAAALLVVIIGAPVFSRREARPAIVPAPPPAPASAPIPAYVLDSPEEAPAEKRAEVRSRPAAPPPPSAARKGAIPARPDDALNDADRERLEGARPNEALRDEVAANADRADPVAAAEAPAAVTDTFAYAPPPESKQTTGAGATARRQSAAAPAGGEAGSSGEGDASAPITVKLVIQPADGGGEPPEVTETPSDERLASLRGKKYLLVVEPAGRVVSVEEQPAGRKLSKDKTEDSRARTDDQRTARMRSLAESLLRELVFHPGDRSRRLVVAVQ